jgi:hypothetical protein
MIDRWLLWYQIDRQTGEREEKKKKKKRRRKKKKTPSRSEQK